MRNNENKRVDTTFVWKYARTMRVTGTVTKLDPGASERF